MYTGKARDIKMKQIALFERKLEATPIVPLSGNYGANQIFMKRDDLIPFSFGGNKARKAAEFYKEIKKTDTDIVMTYGSNSSNHCRMIANMAASMGLSCHIISPEENNSPGENNSLQENRELLYNRKLVKQLGAVTETCPVSRVAETIEQRIEAFRKEDRKPYFIQGGGHGNPGTEGYVKAYQEILTFEEEKNIYFDYIFHASGTGTTQAGLVCGKLLDADRKRKVVGISIAREEFRGREVVKESIKEYLGEKFEFLYTEDELVFTDAYRLGGYGCYNDKITYVINEVMKREGIPMDTTYVGKAFYGMCEYLKENVIENKKVLFIHTGGTPLYFDRLS